VAEKQIQTYRWGFRPQHGFQSPMEDTAECAPGRKDPLFAHGDPSGAFLHSWGPNRATGPHLNSAFWTGTSIAYGTGSHIDTGFRNSRLRVGSESGLGVP